MFLKWKQAHNILFNTEPELDFQPKVQLKAPVKGCSSSTCLKLHDNFYPAGKLPWFMPKPSKWNY